MAKAIEVKGTLAKLYQPTAAKKYWRIRYPDRATGELIFASGGKTYAEAEQRARALMGEYVEGWRAGEQPPTVKEATDLWLATKKSEWSGRTYQHGVGLVRKLTDPLGDRLVTLVFPQDIAKHVQVEGLSRKECERIRSTVRGVFAHSVGWIKEEAVEPLAKAVPLPGTSADKRNPRVERGDIPSSHYVAALIITASHTAQVGPLDDPETTTVDPATGKKDRSEGAVRLIEGSIIKQPTADYYRDGLPAEDVNKHRRVRVMKHQTPEQQASEETEALAERYRQIALGAALGAAGGLRIGELLALRVRHFLSREQLAILETLNWDRTKLNGTHLAFRGEVEVAEQASQSGTGKILVQGTKGRTKRRLVHLPAFLPNWHGNRAGSVREQIGLVLPRFQDRGVSLWDATDEESIELWQHGFTPVGMLLWDRLTELWRHPALFGKGLGAKVKDLHELLLFPTRSKPRRGRDGTTSVLTESGWRKETRIVDGAGGYQNQSNFQLVSNPVADHVATDMDEWPEHRMHSKQRRGWTHHSLRHWAVSSRIREGVPLPLIAQEMGHKDSAFTLQRYGHVVDEGVGPQGFEY